MKKMFMCFVPWDKQDQNHSKQVHPELPLLSVLARSKGITGKFVLKIGEF